MIESISALTLATHDMPRAERFYAALGFDLIYGGADAPFHKFPRGILTHGRDRAGASLSAVTIDNRYLKLGHSPPGAYSYAAMRHYHPTPKPQVTLHQSRTFRPTKDAPLPRLPRTPPFSITAARSLAMQPSHGWSRPAPSAPINPATRTNCKKARLIPGLLLLH
jgi:hypothetical protein